MAFLPVLQPCASARQPWRSRSCTSSHPWLPQTWNIPAHTAASQSLPLLHGCFGGWFWLLPHATCLSVPNACPVWAIPSLSSRRLRPPTPPPSLIFLTIMLSFRNLFLLICFCLLFLQREIQGIIYFQPKEKIFFSWGFLIDLLSAKNLSLVLYFSL